jgi:recombination protein RecT
MSNITKAEKEPLSVKAAVEAPEFKRELARIVGDAVGADRVARMVITSIARTPGLAECTPKSVLSAVYQAVQLGLTLDGRHAHLVPFRDGDKKVCTLVPDYKGLIQLALKSKIVTAITLETVCENDDFQWDRGVITRHTVDWRSPRGEAYAWYAIAKMAGGGEACVVLPRSEVEAIRARSKKGSKQSPWDTDFNEMAKKTAFKRLAKVLPLTPEFAEAERLEDEPTDVTPKTAAAAFERPQRPALPEPQPEAERPEAKQAEEVAVTVVADDAVPDSIALATSKGFTMQEVTDYLRGQGFIENDQSASALSGEHNAGLMRNQVGFLGALGKARSMKGGAR